MTMTMNSHGDQDAADVRAAQLIEGVVGNAWATDASGKFTYVSHAMLALLGATLPDLNSSPEDDGLGWRRMIHPDDCQAVVAAWRHSVRTGDRFNVACRMIGAANTCVRARCSGQPLRDNDGRIFGWYGAFIDGEGPSAWSDRGEAGAEHERLPHDEVTASDVHRKTEETLRESERALRELVETLPARIWCTTPGGEPFYFSRQLREYYGFNMDAKDDADSSRLGAILSATIHPDDLEKVGKLFAQSLATGEPYAVRHRQRRHDGVYRWVQTHATAMRDVNGQIERWNGVNYDIDDLVSAQESLRAGELRLQQLIDTVPAPIWGTNAEGEPSYINKPLQEYSGISLDALNVPDRTRLASAIGGAVHPDDADVVREALRHSFTSGERFALKYRHRRADGSYRWVDGQAEPLRDTDGRILQWYGVCLDIDDEVRSQETLRARERELSQLIDMVPSHIWRLSPDGEPIFFNKRMVDYLRMDVADIATPGRSRLQALVSAVHPEDASGFEKALRHSLATGESFAMQYRLRRSDGVYRWMSGRAEPMRDDSERIVQWFGLCHDIDDQMRLYSDIAEREARIRRLVDSDIIGIVIWDLDGTLIDANDAFLRMVQYDREDVKAGIRWLDMTPPEWQEVHAREEAEELAATGKMQPREKEYFRKDGSRVPILIGAACFDGQSQQGVAYILDLTERKRAEEALRESERSLRELVETLPAMIDCATPDGEPVFRSRGLREFLGYNLEDLDDAESRLASTLDAGVHPDDLAGVKKAYAHSLSTGQPYARRHRLRRFDGEYRWVETRAAPMRNVEGVIVQWNVVCLDIDGEVRTQEELRLSQEKLARAGQAASLAELSASIAHEVNQPLAAVVANSHACQRWLTAEPPNLDRARITVERIIRDANSAADVVSHIRALFKQTLYPRTASSLGELIAEVRGLMADELRKNGVTVVVELDADMPPVAFERVQLQQVLVNLMRNAVEAMSSVRGARTMIVRAQTSGEAIEVRVSDSGVGIPMPDKIFEPFFTTKENGMGMGLAVSRSIVESHGGRLWAENNDEKGSTFVFTLPVKAKDPE